MAIYGIDKAEVGEDWRHQKRMGLGIGIVGGCGLRFHQHQSINGYKIEYLGFGTLG